jgi:hypothetical protein
VDYSKAVENLKAKQQSPISYKLRYVKYLNNFILRCVSSSIEFGENYAKTQFVFTTPIVATRTNNLPRFEYQFAHDWY